MPEREPPMSYSEENLNTRERSFAGVVSGWLMLAVILVVAILGVGGTLAGLFGRIGPVPFIITGIVSVFLLSGLFVINPNEAIVLQLAGKYAGSIRVEGFHWVIPVYSKAKITLRSGRAAPAAHLQLPIAEKRRAPLERRGPANGGAPATGTDRLRREHALASSSYDHHARD